MPTISFDGIAPGETFTYRFPIVQAGTYWYHCHSGFQEPDGAIVIEPKGGVPYAVDRDYVVQLTDKHPHSGHRIMRNLKMMPDYYNRKRQTAVDFFKDVKRFGFDAAVAERQAWGEMCMIRSDVEDVQGFTALINGKGPSQNWTGLFTPGEKVQLRFINSSAMTYFDIRIPGLKMTVVQADGNEVAPVKVDELRIAVAETYDVVVEPRDAKTYTIFAESMGRSGYARATLATARGANAEMPGLRAAPLLTMADMGMSHGSHGTIDHSAMGNKQPKTVDHAAMGHGQPEALDDGSSTLADWFAPGSGLVPSAENSGRFLSYGGLGPVNLCISLGPQRAKSQFV